MLSGKTAFITGSNRGIGKSILKRFVENKANIICSVRKIDDKFSSFVKDLSNKYKVKIEILEFDLQNEVSMKDSIEKLHKKIDKIDILVNNAGIPGGAIFEMTSMKNLKNIFEINFFSQIRLTQLLLKFLKKSKNGSIVNIGSISGVVPERGNLMYGSSKASLMFATRIMSKEFSNYNIRVNAVAPSVTATEMLDKMDKKAMEKMLKMSNLSEPLSTSEVADEVLFLASEKSLQVNGQIIRLEGNKIDK